MLTTKRQDLLDNHPLASGYDMMAMNAVADFLFLSGTTEDTKKALETYTKVYKRVVKTGGQKVVVNNLEVNMQKCKRKLAIGDHMIERRPLSEDELESRRMLYKSLVEAEGESGHATLQAGYLLAFELYKSHCTIEHQRLLTKIHSISRRVHGESHETTKQITALLEEKKTFGLTVFLKQTGACFQALAYEEDYETLVVKGPYAIPRRMDDEKVMRLPARDLRPHQDGTPVVCHGLKNASHLNGKIGDLRGYNPETGRFKLHFEDKSLKPALVKSENLHIIFEFFGEDGNMY